MIIVVPAITQHSFGSITIITAHHGKQFFSTCASAQEGMSLGVVVVSFVGSDARVIFLTNHTQEPKVGIKTGKRICCCCPETKKVRDECVVFKGEEHADCVKAILAHKECLRDEGFDVK